MEVKAAGSVFLVVLLVLFPTSGAAQPSSSECVTYKETKICGIKGASVTFPCSYPKNRPISIVGWFSQTHSKPLKEISEYSSRIDYPKHGEHNCMMRLRDLKMADKSIFYFRYNFRNVTGHSPTCRGSPGVRLQVFMSPVKIMLKLVNEQMLTPTSWTVMEGSRINLTCVPTCATNLNSNRGYIWYKNSLQLNGSRGKNAVMSFDPISIEDTGNYVCAMIGHKDVPSSALNLSIQRKSKNVVSDKTPSGESNKDSVLTPTRGSDVQNSTATISNNWTIPEGKSTSRFFIVLAASVCIGLVIAITAAVLLCTAKKRKKKKTERCASSVPEPPNNDNSFYMALDINSRSAVYDTLDTTKPCSAAETVYENIYYPKEALG